LNIEAVIKKTVKETIKGVNEAINEAIEAGRKQAEQRPKNTYKATERRLHTLNDLKAKVEQDKAYLEDLKLHGLSRHSKDLVRFQKSGVRLDDGDIQEALVQDYVAQIAANQYAIDTVENAFKALEADEYYKVIEMRYFKRMSLGETGEKLHCDATTVWRNQRRLVERISVRIYGREAI